MSKITIRRFKRMWQLVNAMGHTIANCNSEPEALRMRDELMHNCNPYPFSVLRVGEEYVDQRRGHTIRHINKYP